MSIRISAAVTLFARVFLVVSFGLNALTQHWPAAVCAGGALLVVLLLDMTERVVDAIRESRTVVVTSDRVTIEPVGRGAAP